MTIGDIRTRRGTFKDSHDVSISKDKGYLTNSLDNARIMSLLAQILERLEELNEKI